MYLRQRDLLRGGLPMNYTAEAPAVWSLHDALTCDDA
ncbi:hypothetical protein BX257_1503 [Streptomyces sp. 3212.3]|nr:hypothetical protein BX257_1503 [Streptomyces sp. 3212.3]